MLQLGKTEEYFLQITKKSSNYLLSAVVPFALFSVRFYLFCVCVSSSIIERVGIDPPLNQPPADIGRHVFDILCNEYTMFAVVPSLAGH